MRNEVSTSKELTLRHSLVKTDTLLPRLEPDAPISDRSLWERYVRHKLLLTNLGSFETSKTLVFYFREETPI